MLETLNHTIEQAVSDYLALILLGTGTLGLALLAGLAIWAKRTTKPLRPIALSFSMNLALLLNAEGMWVIATETLKLGALFAVLVFAVFEIAFLTATSLAAEQYRKKGHPGRMLWVAFAIAVTSGVIVASSARTGTEQLLRIALPLIIFAMWWAALTAAGVRQHARSRFAYSPRRLAELWGWLIPDQDTDLTAMKATRQVRRMVVSQQRANSAFSAVAAVGKWRLSRDARTATDDVIGQVRTQLARIAEVSTLVATPAPMPLETIEAADSVSAVPDFVPAELAEAPVSPAPVAAPRRRVSGSPSAGLDGWLTVLMATAGQADAKAVAQEYGAGVATVRKYNALVRELHGNPHADIDAKRRSVRPDCVDAIRGWAREVAAR